jgi:hypothetical protein
MLLAPLLGKVVCLVDVLLLRGLVAANEQEDQGVAVGEAVEPADDLDHVSTMTDPVGGIDGSRSDVIVCVLGANCRDTGALERRRLTTEAPLRVVKAWGAIGGSGRRRRRRAGSRVRVLRRGQATRRQTCGRRRW